MICHEFSHPAREMIGPPISSGRGLTAAEAVKRLEQYGPNMAPEERRHPLLALLRKLWAPVPWMLEVTIILELLLGHYAEAEIIGVLLIVNATLSFVQEGRAHNALALLRQRLTVRRLPR
jgi:H+-transporting ATPase